MKAINITLIICFSCFMAITLYFGAVALKVNNWCSKLDVKPYTQRTNFTYNTKTNYTIEEIRNLLESDFDIGLYFYKEKSIKYAGGTTIFQLRLICIDKMTTLDKSFYAYELAHELTHLKYYNGNECWVEFMTWKYLYESGNEFLYNTSLWLANYKTQNHLQNQEDCGWWILEYLSTKNS